MIFDNLRGDHVKRYEAIRVALKTLGIHGHIRIKGGGDQVQVYVDGEYFGIYDFERKTFVD